LRRYEEYLTQSNPAPRSELARAEIEAAARDADRAAAAQQAALAQAIAAAEAEDARSSGGGVRCLLTVRLQGAELVRGRQEYMVYKLQVQSHRELPVLYRRFSQFVSLLEALRARDLAHAPIPLTAEQLADLEEWHRKLRQEKKRAVKPLGALGGAVVHRRCVLLQQMLDSVLTPPPLCFQPEVCTFFSKDSP
jgi:hypothetical protein